MTYHGLHVPGWSYAENDHVALEQDLQLLAGLGFKVSPLRKLVNLVLNAGEAPKAGDRWVAITFDDATDLDFHDFYHAEYGHLKSFRRILSEAKGLGFDGSLPSATSFVIASPAARRSLDVSCIAGRGQWNDGWWLDAALDGPLQIANHSWDHVHPALQEWVVDAKFKGRFDLIADFASADAEILAAQEFICGKTRKLCSPYFAYPYGHSNEFLSQEYFPARTNVFEAAFITGGRPVCADDNRWLIPRLVCGEHWDSSQALEKLLLA